MYQAILQDMDLASLPPPEVIEEPVFQEIFNSLLALHQTLSPNYAYYVAGDPVVIDLQAIAYREMLWRQTLNHKGRARLIAFASGADLEHFAANWGIERRLVAAANPNANPPTPEITESDEILRRRTQDRMAAFSSAGSEAAYLFYARSADTRITDVKAYSPDVYNGFNMGGRVHVAVLAAEGAPVPDVLANVEEVLLSDKVKPISDYVFVEAATTVPVTISARLVLEPGMSLTAVDAAKQALIVSFIAHRRLGWNITKTWITRTLAIAGVHEVILDNPTTSLAVEPNQVAAITAYNIGFAGYAIEEDWSQQGVQYRQAMEEATRYFIDYTILHALTHEQIRELLSAPSKAGVVKPTVVSVCQYIGLPTIYDGNGVQRPDEDLAFMLWTTLKVRYA